jgi:hypothetical protein
VHVGLLYWCFVISKILGIVTFFPACIFDILLATSGGIQYSCSFICCANIFLKLTRKCNCAYNCFITLFYVVVHFKDWRMYCSFYRHV